MRIDFFCAGANVKGTYKDAPGAPSSTGATGFTSAFFIVFHAIVTGSNQPPRNQQWSTTVLSSVVKMAKSLFKKGCSLVPSSERIKPFV